MSLSLRRPSELCQKGAAVPADMHATCFAAKSRQSDNQTIREFRCVVIILLAQEMHEVTAEAARRQQSPAVLAFSQLWWRNASHFHGSRLRCLSLPASAAAMSTSCLQTCPQDGLQTCLQRFETLKPSRRFRITENFGAISAIYLTINSL